MNFALHVITILPEDIGKLIAIVLITILPEDIGKLIAIVFCKIMSFFFTVTWLCFVNLC